MTSAAKHTVAIVGAGVSGLTAAVNLQQRGWNVTVFERANQLLPIVQTVTINDIVYDYLSQALLPVPVNGEPSSTALGQLAERYQQPFEPFELTANTVSFDTITGVSPVPPPFQPFFTSAEGQEDLLEQLAEGWRLIQRLGKYQPTPEGAVEAGLVEPNQTYAEWALQANLTAFTGISELLVNSAVSGPAQSKAAAIELNENREFSAGLIRQAFLQAGGCSLNWSCCFISARWITSMLATRLLPAAKRFCGDKLMIIACHCLLLPSRIILLAYLDAELASFRA